jgi:hypothetical protein
MFKASVDETTSASNSLPIQGINVRATTKASPP